MKINGKTIAHTILSDLRKKTKKARLKPSLAVFLVKPSPENILFVKAKEKAVRSIGGVFKLIRTDSVPDFEDFANTIKKIAHDPKVHALIIQQPLPASLSTESLYDYIGDDKEIEGHKKKPYFYPPIGLAVLTMLKHIYYPGVKKKIEDTIIDMKKDRLFFKRVLKRKKIVLVGRGETGGKPIAQMLTYMKINFLNIHSQTPNAHLFEQEADIIISAVGKKVIDPKSLKNGVVLISVGIRKKDGVWKGDYDEKEIADIASFYTPTPGGIGPLDIAYLMHNLLEAAKMQ